MTDRQGKDMVGTSWGTINRLVMLLVFAEAWEGRRGWNHRAKPADRDRPWLQTRPRSEALPLSVGTPLRRSCHPPPPASSVGTGHTPAPMLLCLPVPKQKGHLTSSPFPSSPSGLSAASPAGALGVCCCEVSLVHRSRVAGDGGGHRPGAL